jgi:hypothetical protein
LGIEVEVEATAPATSTRGPATAPSTRCRGVGVVGAVIGVCHNVVRFVYMLKRFVEFICWIVSVYCFVLVIVVPSVYITFVMVCRTVGVLHQSRVCWRQGPLACGKACFLRFVSMSVHVAVGFFVTGLFTTVAFAFHFIFR